MTDTVEIKTADLPDGDILVIRRNSRRTLTRGNDIVRVDNTSSCGCYYEVLEHRPRPFSEGDEIRSLADSPGKIIHINGEKVWIKWGDGSEGIHILSKLKRA